MQLRHVLTICVMSSRKLRHALTICVMSSRKLRHVLTISVMSRHKSRNTAWMLVTSKGMVPEVFEGILKSFKSWRVPEGSWGSLEILESLLEVLGGT